MKRAGLSARLSLFILAGVAVVYFAALAYNYHLSKKALLTDLVQDARHLSQAVAGKVTRILTAVEKVPESLATYLEDQTVSAEELRRLLRRTLARNPEIFGMAVAFEPYAYLPTRHYFAPYAYRDGSRLITVILGSPRYHYFTMDWYQIPRETGKPLWVAPYYDEGGGDILMTSYSVPVYRQTPLGGRRFKGVVTADLSLSWLREMVSGVKILQSGYAFLISQNGTFVTFPDKNYIMRETIFSLAAAQNRPELRRLGRRLLRGEEDFVPLQDLKGPRRVWLYFTPVGQTGWSLGVVFPEDELLADLWRLSQKLLFLGLGGLLLLGVVITLLSRTITRPLRRLAETTAVVAQGDFSVRVPEAGPREIAELAASFNQMGQKLVDYIAKRDFIRDTFGRYVTQEVVKKLLEDQEALALGGETREVTILMSDLRGFTLLTAHLAPERIITLLNRYLGKMIEILTDFQAVIDDIHGDGILAFFGAPTPQPDHPARAVACALTMQLAMEEVNAANAKDGFPHLEMGIGVGSGTVVVGNIGSELRTKYSVVGSPVNFTSRIEALAMPGQVLISADTYRRVQDLVEVGEVLEVAMKGILGRVTLYEVRGLGAPYSLRLKIPQEARVALPRPLAVRLDRLQDKVVVATFDQARLSHLSESGARLMITGELAEWEDVRLHLPDPEVKTTFHLLYAKVTAFKSGPEEGSQAELRFTSVPPLARQAIQQLLREIQG